MVENTQQTVNVAEKLASHSRRIDEKLNFTKEILATELAKIPENDTKIHYFDVDGKKIGEDSASNNGNLNIPRGTTKIVTNGDLDIGNAIKDKKVIVGGNLNIKGCVSSNNFTRDEPLISGGDIHIEGDYHGNVMHAASYGHYNYNDSSHFDSGETIYKNNGTIQALGKVKIDGYTSNSYILAGDDVFLNKAGQNIKIGSAGNISILDSEGKEQYFYAKDTISAVINYDWASDERISAENHVVFSAPKIFTSPDSQGLFITNELIRIQPEKWGEHIKQTTTEQPSIGVDQSPLFSKKALVNGFTSPSS